MRLLFILLLFPICSYTQIIEEYTYENASIALYMVNLEQSGLKYVVKSEEEGNRFLKLYHLNHALWKNIDVDEFPASEFCGIFGNQQIFDALYISENLFDCDDQLEFMYVSLSDCHWFTGIYKEDGTAIFEGDSLAPLVRLNMPPQHRPIYATDGTAIMILSHQAGHANVYTLPCNLSTNIDRILEYDMNVYPNPTFYQTRIDYELPEGVDEARLEIRDNTGRLAKEYTIDRQFNTLSIPVDDLQPSTYYYSIIANGQKLVTTQVLKLAN